MIKAQPKGLSPTWYVPEGQDESEDVTSFYIAPVDQMTLSEVLMNSDDYEGIPIPSDKARQVLIRKGLKGWKGFLEEDGSEIKFNPNNVTRIPAEVLLQLSGKIFDISVVDQEEKKASSSEPQSPETETSLTASTASGADTAMTPTHPPST